MDHDRKDDDPIGYGENRILARAARQREGHGDGEPAAQAAQHAVRLQVVKLPPAKRGFVLLPKRWVVERSFAWAARFRRLARDYERLASTLGAFHFLAFACLMIANLFRLLA